MFDITCIPRTKCCVILFSYGQIALHKHSRKLEILSTIEFRATSGLAPVHQCAALYTGTWHTMQHNNGLLKLYLSLLFAKCEEIWI